VSRLLTILLITVAATSAEASAPDLFGLGAEQAAMAGASSAAVHDFAAALYNPAGLTRADRREFSVGVLGFGSHLTVGGVVKSIEEPFGVVVGAAAPVPFGDSLRDRIYIGIALYILPDAIVRVISRRPDEPFFPYYDNRTQRLVVLPSLAVRIGWGFSVGIAINYLAGLGGVVTATEGTTRAVEPRVDEAIFGTAKVNAGVLWRSPHDRLAFAAVFRQGFSVPFSTVTNNLVAGQPINLDIDAEGLFMPHQLQLGVAGRPKPWLRLTGDAVVGFWSTWRGPYVTVVSELPIAGSLSAPPPKLDYSDTISLRAGAEASRILKPFLVGKLRAGYAFETSPIPASQPGVTNLIDAPKHTVALGGGLDFSFGEVRFLVDVAGQIQALQPRTLDKTVAPAGTSPDPATALRDELPNVAGIQISNPGYPSISGGGFVWTAQLTLTVMR
jgi:long-subunit fatty acid transport protein